MSIIASLSRPGPRWTGRVLWANLVAQIGIIVTGGAVRLTGSGLGCSDWPQCEPGQFTPVMHEATSFHPYVEFGNRALTGVLVIVAVAALWVVWRRPQTSGWLRALAVVPLLGVLVQAVIGGLTVLVDLHPAWVGSHLLVSMALVAASTVLVLRERGPAGPARWAVAGRARALVLVLIPVSAAMLTLGTVVTGAGPHSGDDDAPYRYALDPVAITRAHSLSVWLYLIVLVALVWDLRRLARAGSDPAVRAGLRRGLDLLALAVAQGAVGYLQYFLGLPVLLVGLHMLGAALTVVAQAAQLVAVRPTSAPQDQPLPPAASAALAA